MNKKLLAVLLAVLLVVSLASIAACDKTVKHTVTFYDGESVLKEAEVEDGQKAEKYAPTKEGYTFVDWYATPTFSALFNFDDPVTENKSVFSKWTKTAQTADTRTFYILGSGTCPVLLANNWGKVFDDTTKMTKTADKNEYKYTLDLQVGDQFQFAINESWHNQRGVGYLTETKLADGTVAFSGASTIGDNSSYRLNIKCEYAGNYTFTLTTHPDDDTYETNNASYTEANKEAFNINSLDTITWVRNGDVSAVQEVVTDFYIKGSGVTSWKDMYNDATKMSKADGVYTLEVYLKADEEFLFTSRNTVGTDVSVGTEYLRASNLDNASKTYVDQKTNYNMVAKAAGTYTFTYTESTKVLSVAFNADKIPVATDYYIDGTFADGVADWSGYCFASAYKLVETASGSGVYEIKNLAMKADSQFIIQAFKAGATERGEWGTAGYNGLGNYNFTYLSGGGDAFTAVGDGNNNIKVVTADTYDVTFDSYSKIITVVKHVESKDTLDIYIKRENINGWAHNWSADYLMTITADETKYEYTFTVTDGKAVSFGFEKHPKGEKTGYGDYLGVAAIGTSGDANDKFLPASGSNFACSQAGTYKAVYTIATGKVDFYAVTNS